MGGAEEPQVRTIRKMQGTCVIIKCNPKKISARLLLMTTDLVFDIQVSQLAKSDHVAGNLFRSVQTKITQELYPQESFLNVVLNFFFDGHHETLKHDCGLYSYRSHLNPETR